MTFDEHSISDVITAAGDAGINIIPLAWTLVNPGETWEDTSVPRINAVTQAVIAKPGPVIAVALGDEVRSPSVFCIIT